MAEQSKWLTVFTVLGIGALMYYMGSQLGTMLFGRNIFGSAVNILGFSIGIILAAVMVFFALAALFLDVQSYPKFFFGAVIGLVAVVLWISPLDTPTPVEEILATVASAWLTVDSTKSRRQQQLPLL